jgi:hypothetical protein
MIDMIPLYAVDAVLACNTFINTNNVKMNVRTFHASTFNGAFIVDTFHGLYEMTQHLSYI